LKNSKYTETTSTTSSNSSGSGGGTKKEEPPTEDTSEQKGSSLELVSFLKNKILSMKVTSGDGKKDKRRSGSLHESTDDNSRKRSLSSSQDIVKTPIPDERKEVNFDMPLQKSQINDYISNIDEIFEVKSQNSTPNKNKRISEKKSKKSKRKNNSRRRRNIRC